MTNHGLKEQWEKYVETGPRSLDLLGADVPQLYEKLLRESWNSVGMCSPLAARDTEHRATPGDTSDKENTCDFPFFHLPISYKPMPFFIFKIFIGV